MLQFINFSTTEFNSSLNPIVSHAFGHNMPLKAQTLQEFDVLFGQSAFVVCLSLIIHPMAKQLVGFIFLRFIAMAIFIFVCI
jgi:hypothetical protein